MARVEARTQRGDRSVRRRPLVVAVSVALAISGVGCAELMALELPVLTMPTAPLNESTVAAGLRQALDVGARRTSESLSRTGSFSDDPLIRIALPQELSDVASTLRAVGFGAQVDRLELQMNRAAEAAAAEAVPVFADAVRSMTIEDAFGILRGPDDAATRYLQARTSDGLRSRFAPIAKNGMEQVGLYRAYRDVVTQYDRIPFKTAPAPDLEAHVIDRALAGLWSGLAAEETRIREDPAARTTELLRQVFAR